jgi:deoxyhypusine synthase
MELLSAQGAVLQKSDWANDDFKTVVRGQDFEGDVSLDSLLGSFLSTGFQATNMGLAIHEINRMAR